MTPTIVRGDSVTCCWEGQGMGWGRFRVPSDLCGRLRGNVRNLVHRYDPCKGLSPQGVVVCQFGWSMIRRSEHLLRSTRFVVFANWAKRPMHMLLGPWTLDRGFVAALLSILPRSRTTSWVPKSVSSWRLRCILMSEVQVVAPKGVKDPKDL